MATLRLREDLLVEPAPAEDDGLRFVDVSDPRSGASMRMYEHEWMLAQRLDGAASYAEVAGWAEANVGFHPSAEDIAGYARALASLGFFDEPELVHQVPVGGAAPPATPPRDEASFADLDAPAPAPAAPPAWQPPPAPIGLARTVALDAPDAADLDAARAAAEIEQTIEHRTRTTSEAMPVTLPGGAPIGPTTERMEATAPPATPVAVAPSPSGRVGGVPTYSDLVNTEKVREPQPPITPTPARGAPLAPPAPLIAPQDLTPEAPARSGGLLGLAALALIAVAGGAAYLFLTKPAVSVRPQTVAPARDVVHYAESKAVVKRQPPVVLSFRDGGKVVDVVPAGTVVTAGKTLATLESYQTLQKELADVRDRETFYENAFKAANARNRRGDAKVAATKVAEKRALRVTLEDKVSRARIVAAGAGTVTEVVAAAGAMVAAGAPVLRVTDKRLLADAKVAPAEASLFKPGAELEAVAGAPDGKPGFPVRVASVEGDTAHLSLDEAASVDDGATLTLVRSVRKHVVTLPATAVVKSQGGADQVFLVTGEVVTARPVTVVERGPTEVLVAGDGFAGNDRVVVAPPPTLQEGQKVVTTQP